MNQSSPAGQGGRANRSWRRSRWVRIGVPVLAVLAALVLLAPSLIPQRRLCRLIANRLASATNGTAEVGSVRLGWLSGLRLSGLSLGMGGGNCKLKIADLRVPFEPFRMAAGLPLTNVTVDNLTVQLCGQDSLPKLGGGGGGAANFPVERMQVSNLTVQIVSADGFQHTVYVPSLVTDSEKQTMGFFGQATLNTAEGPRAGPRYAGRCSVKGELRIVQQGSQKCFAGTVNANWQDVDLSSLRAQRQEGLNVSRLEGIVGGKLTFNIFPDLHFDWRFDAAVRDLVVQGCDAATPNRVESLHLMTAGRHDPVTGNLELTQAAVQSPGLDIRGKMAAKIDETGLLINDLDLGGTFDSSRLTQILPAIQDSLGPDGKISGPAKFDLHWTAKPPAYLLRGNLQADELEVTGSDVIAKAKSMPLNWSVDARSDSVSWPWMVVDNFTFNFGNLNLSGSGQLPGLRPTDDLSGWFESVRRLAQFELVARIAKVEELGETIKAIQPMFGQANLSGPVRLRLGYAGQDDVGRTDVDLELAPSATLDVGDYFSKPRDQSLGVMLQNFWPWRSAQPQAWFNYQVRSGPAAIVNVNQQPVKVQWAFSRKGSGPATLDVMMRLAGEVRGLDDLLAQSPRLKADGWPNRVGGVVGVNGSTVARLTLTDEGWLPDRVRVQGEVRGERMTLDWPGQVSKPQNVPLDWSADYRYSAHRQRHEIRTSLRWQDLSARLAVVRSMPAGAKEAAVSGDASLQIDELDDMVAALPGLMRRFNGRIFPDGKVSAKCQWALDDQAGRLEWNLDAHDAGLVYDGHELKLPGVPASFNGRVDMPRSDDPELRSVKITKLEGQVGKSYVRLGRGPGLFQVRSGGQGKWLKLLGVEPWLAWRAHPVEKIDLDLAGRFDADNGLLTVIPGLTQAIRDFGMVGWGEFDLRTRLAYRQLQVHLTSRFDSFGMFYRNRITKSPGTPAGLDVTVLAWPDGEDAKQYRCLLEGFRAYAGPITLRATGSAAMNWIDSQHVELHEGSSRIELGPVDLLDLSLVSALAGKFQTGGKVFADVAVRKGSQGLAIGPSRVQFDQAGGQINHQPILLDGAVRFSSDYCRSDRLDMVVGDSSIRGTWDVFLKNGGVIGAAAFVTRRADADQMQKNLAAVVAEFIPPQPGAAPATPTMQVSPQAEQERLVRFGPLRKFAERSDFHVSLNAKSFHATDPRSGISHQLSDFIGQFELGRQDNASPPIGAVKFWSHVSGGFISGNFLADLSQENPPLVLSSAIDHVTMTPAMSPLVENFFPGMHVKGTATITEDNSTLRMFSTSEAGPNFPSGSGKMVFVDGYMVGRAAPEWVTKIFPGLNFTRYEFDRMHNWFTKHADGTVHNNMIFLGYPWNLYMEGDSKPDGLIEYEIGVDLMARYESEYWSSVGQGRIPIFATSGRIVKGTLTEQKVNYVPLPELTYRVFVKNNALTGAYRVLMRQLGVDVPKEGFLP